jgi:class 3 adenylate cyclase
MTLFDLQFVGDGMLAFFNAPHAVSDHAAQACEAAQAAQHSLDQFNQATPLWRASAVGFSA